MRVRSWVGALLVLAIVGAATPAVAQDVNEEVRRAVERAVGASIATSVSESLSRSIVSEGLRLMPNNTLFASPFYNKTEADFGLFSFDADTFGGTVGGLVKVHEAVLLHAAFAGATTSVDVSNGLNSSFDSHFVQLPLGGNFVYVNTAPVKAWLTLEGGIANFGSSQTDDIWSWNAGPSTTFSFRVGDVLFEPNLGFRFSNTFEDDNAETQSAMQMGFALKYRGEVFRPQLNFAYSKSLTTQDDGVISVGPELLFAINPAMLVGVAYNYSRPLDAAIDLNSHTVTLQFRWTF